MADLEIGAYMVPWAHPSPQLKRHLDRFSRFLRAHGRASLYSTMTATLSLKIAPSHAAICTPSNTWFLESTRTNNPNNITSGSVQPFCRAHECNRQIDRQTTLLCL